MVGCIPPGGAAARVLVPPLTPVGAGRRSFSGWARRFFAPWAAAPIPYDVVANPGDAALARGQSLPLSAFVKANGVVDSLPSKATLIMTESSGKTVRLGMKSDQPNVFFVKFNTPTQPFRYR